MKIIVKLSKKDAQEIKAWWPVAQMFFRGPQSARKALDSIVKGA